MPFIVERGGKPVHYRNGYLNYQYFDAYMKPWPHTIGDVDEHKYKEIQNIVGKFIREVHGDSISPIQYDDIYWRTLKYGTH